MSSKFNLTKSQQHVFDFICDAINENGFPPSYSEIATHFNYSSDGTVRTYLEQLERKGFISRSGKARCIRILKPPQKNTIPIIGQIAAGNPLLATEDHIGSITDINVLKHKDGRFALTVKGNSMKNAGIFEGDIAILQANSPIQNKQIAGIIIDEEATLKRVFYENGTIRLQPENPNYSPIILTKKSFESKFIGRLIGIIRTC